MRNSSSDMTSTVTPSTSAGAFRVREPGATKAMTPVTGTEKPTASDKI